jgi:hypothetical protein
MSIDETGHQCSALQIDGLSLLVPTRQNILIAANYFDDISANGHGLGGGILNVHRQDDAVVVNRLLVRIHFPPRHPLSGACSQSQQKKNGVKKKGLGAPRKFRVPQTGAQTDEEPPKSLRPRPGLMDQLLSALVGLCSGSPACS